jgi:glucose-1-phosphate thymidylyltransferase
MEASQYVQTIEHRQGLKVACPEKIAWHNRWISAEQLEQRAVALTRTEYGQYLKQLLS